MVMIALWMLLLRHVQDLEPNAVTHSAIVSSCERDGLLDV